MQRVWTVSLTCQRPNPSPFPPSHHPVLKWSSAADGMLKSRANYSIQFNSIRKTVIIPQGAVLLWSWQAHKTIQQTQHHQQKSLTLTIVIVINIEQLWHHHKIVMNLRSHACFCLSHRQHTHTHNQKPLFSAHCGRNLLQLISLTTEVSVMNGCYWCKMPICHHLYNLFLWSLWKQFTMCNKNYWWHSSPVIGVWALTQLS